MNFEIYEVWDFRKNKRKVEEKERNGMKDRKNRCAEMRKRGKTKNRRERKSGL